ncbi:GTP-binding protein [Limnohabitans sp. JirII-31]|uniref:CobW family GTP-binding protein n=1 Tax=Limnohabitans sp. JirII-31 TaxID=1977908 RepID=UPI000C1DF6EF|nr:GTP-binding protein [Limnohabitans sp. JirII-31]PIT80588.1 hypothetical protein B9Z41_01310 [Limnohabitans sp. JirII-31]
MKSKPIPVWLLTGFLGSGKTSLLLNWLRDPALAHAALVINEIGEVGMDNTLVASVVDSASVLTGACVCCAGLEGLEDTLSELWWDRLYRRRPRFDAVVIETTGVADPRPIQDALRRHPFLRERYALQSTLSTVSATHGCALLGSSQEAVAQVRAADVLIVTKTDAADPNELIAQLMSMHSQAHVLRSAHAGLGWRDVCKASHPLPAPSDDALSSSVGPAVHSHALHADFVSTQAFEDLAALQAQLTSLLSGDLVRLKGIVALKNGQMCAVQWSWLDTALTVTVHEGVPPDQWGVTCIRQAKSH